MNKENMGKDCNFETLQHCQPRSIKNTMIPFLLIIILASFPILGNLADGAFDFLTDCYTALQYSDSPAQAFFKILHEILIYADNYSDVPVVVQILLSISTLFIREPVSSKALLVLHFVTIHFLTKIILTVPDIPGLRMICRTLSCVANFQLLRLYFRWDTREEAKSLTEKLEWSVGPMGYFEWLTPLKQQQTHRVDGFVLWKRPYKSVDVWGGWNKML